MKRILYTLVGLMLGIGAWAQTSLQEQINNAEVGAAITLTDNSEGSITVPADKNLTLDLNGYNITAAGTAITNNGTLTIKDTSAGGKGTIISTSNYGICAGNNSTTTFASGNIVSQEFGIGTSTNTGATVNVTGGTITAKDNAVFGGNGTERSGDPNTFNISGGTFYGEIRSAGYVACGIYSPWNDVFNVSGGTFNITNGCGVLARAGTVNITGGEFNCTGTVTGMVGDSRVVVPCSAIVYDSQAGYPAMTVESNIGVTGGTFTSQVDPVTIVRTGDADSHIDISGGEYSGAIPAEACADGYYPTRDAGGHYSAKGLQEVINATTDGSIVKLTSDFTGQLVIPVGSNVVLDLNGHKIEHTETAIVNNGTLTVKDSGSTGKIVSTGNYGICAGNNSVTTFQSGNIVSQEFGIGTSTNTGATVNVTGGTITAKDNAVFGGNGTNRTGDPNTFNISDGTFYGEIQSAGYVACGIYSPWKDVFNVSGGTFNITNGCGVLARAGTVNITGGEFNCTGTVTGMVGDSRVVVPCSAIVYDSQAGYPAMTTESQIAVEGGTFKSADGVDAVSVVGDSHIAVSGGSFSSILSEDVCAEGFVPVTEKDAEGNYTVISATYVAQIGDAYYQSLAEAVEAAVSGQTITLLDDVAVDKTILIEKNVTIDGAGHTINSTVTSKLGTFYVNTGTCEFTFKNATIDGGNTASMAVCAYRGKANDTLDGTPTVDTKNSGNNITLTDCKVQNFKGWPDSYVGAVYAYSTSTVNLNNCTFSGNTTAASTDGASGADVWAGAAATVNINGGSYQEVFVNADKSNTSHVTISNSAYVAELAIGATYKADGSTNIPTVVVDGATVTTLTTEEGNPIPANEITISNGGTVTNIPAYEVAKIINGTNTKAFASLADALAAVEATETITLLADVTIETLDVVEGKTIDKNEHDITVTSFTLYDNVIFNIPFDFKATTATYSREVGSNVWGTVCVPFTLKSCGDYTLYSINGITGSELFVTEISEDTPVLPGTPVIFHNNGGGTSVTFTSADADVKQADPTPGVQLIGTYQNKKITTDLANTYYINSDQFHQAKVSLTVPAYRAYIIYSGGGSAKPSVLTLNVGGGIDGIESVALDELNTSKGIYDINGRQLTATQKGMNIVKLANGKTVKIIIK